jgi:hypothetical protein
LLFAKKEYNLIIIFTVPDTAYSERDKGAFVKQFSWRALLCAACLFPLFLYARIYGGQSAQPESGISENVKADTVHIPNSTRDKNAETVHIKNTSSTALPDTTILLNSDEPANDREQAQNPNFLTQTPVLSSPTERVRSKGKIIAGSALFGVSYGFSLFVATAMSTGSSSNGAAYFYIPVLGPVLSELSMDPSSADIAPVTVLFLGWSVAQGIGLTLLISGCVGTPAQTQAPSLPFSIEPLVMKDKVGLLLRMRFN